MLWVGFTESPCAKRWKPGGDSTVTVGKHDNSKALVLRGFKYTTITSLECEFITPAIPLVDGNALVQTTLAKATVITSRYIGAEALHDAFAAIPTAGGSKTNIEPLPYGKSDRAAYLAYGAQMEDGFRFAEAVLYGRTYFTTESGYMGMGSRRMQSAGWV